MQIFGTYMLADCTSFVQQQRVCTAGKVVFGSPGLREEHLLNWLVDTGNDSITLCEFFVHQAGLVQKSTVSQKPSTPSCCYRLVIEIYCCVDYA